MEDSASQFKPMGCLPSIVDFILSVFTIPLEILLHHDFGERYLSPVRLALTFSVIPLVAVFAPFVQQIEILAVFFVATSLISSFHFFRIAQRNLQHIRWHSYSFGVSNLYYIPKISEAKINEWMLYCYVEPLLSIVGGILLGVIPYTRVVGVWAVVAGGVLFIKNQLLYTTRRSQLLDRVDAAIEAESYNAAMVGKVKRNVAGFSAVSPYGDDAGLFVVGMKSVIKRWENLVARLKKGFYAVIEALRQEAMRQHQSTVSQNPPPEAAALDFSGTLAEVLGADEATPTLATPEADTGPDFSATLADVLPDATDQSVDRPEGEAPERL